MCTTTCTGLIDRAVISALPSGAKAVSISPSGVSAWVTTARIDCELKDGTPKAYFMKAASGGTAQRMMEGSLESDKVFYQYAPEHVPKPIAAGNYRSNPETWFFLAEFCEMKDEMPAPRALINVLAHIHKSSTGKSPHGKYGFQIPTHLANIPNNNYWQSSWEDFFAQLMETMLMHEEKTHGRDQRLDDLKAALFDTVIPRLLRPLESGGRSIQPCLVHSDIWPGNIAVEAETHRVVLFDSCAFWGHNEADLGSWRAPRYKMGDLFFQEYKKAMPVSEPQEDWDDRNALYSIRYDLLVSALFPGDEGLEYRRLAMKEMERLVTKFS